MRLQLQSFLPLLLFLLPVVAFAGPPDPTAVAGPSLAVTLPVAYVLVGRVGR